jgi:hypothetical protein
VSRLNCFLEVGVDGPDQDVAPELEPANEEADVGDVGIEARPRFGGHRSGIGETDVLGLGAGIVLATRAGNEMVGFTQHLTLQRWRRIRPSGIGPCFTSQAIRCAYCAYPVRF